MSTTEIDEDDLYIDMQLEFDSENNNFKVEYGLTCISSDEPMNIETSFKYDTLAEAWENFRLTEDYFESSINSSLLFKRHLTESVFSSPSIEAKVFGISTRYFEALSSTILFFDFSPFLSWKV